MADTGTFIVHIEGIAAGGAGFARVAGKSVFVEGSAVGETVRCKMLEERRSWSRAEMVEIIEASPCRVASSCALYGVCGGCNVQHIDYPGQIAAKKAILKEAFRRIGGGAVPEPLITESPPWEYRNRMRFHRGQSGKMGLKARKSADIIPVSDCPVADPGIRELLQKASVDQAVLPLPPGKDSVTVYARDGLLLSEGGQTRGKTTLLGREIGVDAAVFFQSNGTVLEALIGDLRECAASADRSLAMADVYCGVGTFAAVLGELFPQVILVEENKPALALARENCRAVLGGAVRAEYIALRDAQWAAVGSGFDGCGFIVVDPPRQGLAPALSARLAAEGPPLLAYVSCDPATLARDSAVLRGGYELAELRFYDFYPQTAHIESLAVFRR